MPNTVLRTHAHAVVSFAALVLGLVLVLGVRLVLVLGLGLGIVAAIIAGSTAALMEMFPMALAAATRSTGGRSKGFGLGLLEGVTGARHTRDTLTPGSARKDARVPLQATSHDTGG